jgi:ribosomal protein L37AE/L43A
MFEEETVQVTCPKCGHKSQENVARLKTDGYTCPKCSTTLDPSQLPGAVFDFIKSS